jgi:hypothetical protein
MIYWRAVRTSSRSAPKISLICRVWPEKVGSRSTANPQYGISKKLCFHHNIGYNIQLLIILCHVVYATKLGIIPSNSGHVALEYRTIGSWVKNYIGMSTS